MYQQAIGASSYRETGAAAAAGAARCGMLMLLPALIAADREAVG